MTRECEVGPRHPYDQGGTATYQAHPGWKNNGFLNKNVFFGFYDFYGFIMVFIARQHIAADARY